MNVDSASNSSGPVSNPRAARGQIAAQACETCRQRKQKCDEARPKCSLCQRMKLECRYREPQPTKKDKTLVEILDKLKRIETKVDRIPTHRMPASFDSMQLSPSSQPSFNPENDTNSFSTSSFRPNPSRTTNQYQVYRHTTAAHQILAWPAIQHLLETTSSHPGDSQISRQDGSTFLIQLQKVMQQKRVQSLPLDDTLQERPFFGMQSQATRVAGGARRTFTILTLKRMHDLADAYFDTFNFLYPFLDRQGFMSETLATVNTEGFDGDTESVLALLVFALGEVAIEGYRGPPVGAYKGRPSGIRGGSITRPPGLALFNEARKTIGFVLTECDLVNVQIFSLAALYYQACSRHVEFWRMTVSASSACQILITCNPGILESPQAELVKRMFWHCAVMETGLQLELDLTPTDIIALEDRVGMPRLDTPFSQADEQGSQSSHFRHHYAAQVALRRLCADLHHHIAQASSNSDTPSETGPTIGTLNDLVSDLTQWRGMLPQELQWPEDDPTVFPSPQIDRLGGSFPSSLDPNLPQLQRTSEPLFTTNPNVNLVYYSYAYDIQVALLRTRYYYAKFMIHRPFVYKALHFPDHITEADAKAVAECLQSCLKWPLTLYPVSTRKRLVPYLFCWSQIFMSILLIIHLTKHNDMLHKIRTQLCGPRFEADIDVSMTLMIDWIRDLKELDPIAKWCYKVLQPIYDLDPDP